MTGDYLTTEEVCKKTKTSRRTIYRRLKSGELRGKKFGSVWRFRPEEVERLVPPVRRESREIRRGPS